MGARLVTGDEKYTSIGGVFRYEIAFIKLCAGLLLDTHKLISIAYRVSVMILTRYLAFKYFIVYPQQSDAISKEAWHNINIFWATCHITSFIILFGLLATGIRNQKLLTIILNKRFDKRYLTPGDLFETQHPRAPLSVQPSAALSSASSSSNSGSNSELVRDSLPLANWTGRRHRLPSHADPTTVVANATDTLNYQHSHYEYLFTRVSRIKLLRFLLLLNLLLATLSAFLRDELSRNYKPKKSPPQARRNATISATNVNSGTHQVNLVPGTSSFTTSGANNTQLTAGDFVDTLSLEQLLSLTFSRPAAALGRFLLHFVNASLNVNQIYGQIYVVLMVTVVLTDMLKNSASRDIIMSESFKPDTGQQYNSYKLEPADRNQKHQSNTNHTTIKQERAKSHMRRIAHKPMLTTELLIQVRDVLMALRIAMSLDYLMLMLFDMSRLMNTFCIFTAFISSDRITTALLVFCEYLRIVFSASITRLGYHWLHTEARKLRLICECKILEMAVNAHRQNSQQSSAPMSDISRAELTTTFRLTREIENMWPTDWFTPDLKSYVADNFFVITSVATLQQLVEASAKAEYQVQHTVNGGSPMRN